MFTAPVVGVVLDARVFVDAHLILIDDPPQWRPPIDDIFVRLGRDVFDRDVRVVLEFGKIAFGRRFELLKCINISTLTLKASVLDRNTSMRKIATWPFYLSRQA